MKTVDSSLRVQKTKSGLPTGLVFDETSHLKKGLKSVGVSGQYAGVVGNVDKNQFSKVELRKKLKSETTLRKTLESNMCSLLY